jgi:serine/threonine protein kinase
LTSLWEDLNETGNMEPLVDWPEDDIPDLNAGLKRLLSRMTNLDPAKRATISDILKDPYWD